MTQAHPRKSNQSAVVAISLLGDGVFTYLALSFSYWLRFETALKNVGVPPDGAYYQLYIPLLILGTLSLIATFAYLGLYNDKQIILHKVLLNKRCLPSLQKNVAILGVNQDAGKLFEAMSTDKNQPYNPVGIISRSDAEDSPERFWSRLRKLGHLKS
jgi:hypothetical protein